MGWIDRYPGRCPGLVCAAPLGLKTGKTKANTRLLRTAYRRPRATRWQGTDDCPGPQAVLHCLTMNTLTIRLPEELRADLQKISQDESKPVSDVVRESLRRYVAVAKFRSLRRRVLPFAEAQGLVTDEDVFEALS